jgi:hypothetical protein
MNKRAGFSLAVLMMGGCRQPTTDAPWKPAPFLPIAENKLLMAAVVDPAADAVWESVSITIDKTGEHDRSPKTDEEWNAVRNSAVTLAESGNLLMISPRAKDDDQWMKMSRALVETSFKALQAAQERDAKKLLNVGGDIDEACENCHVKYRPPGY